MDDSSDLGDAFDAMLRCLDHPLVIATAAAGGEADGCLVGFATQASIEPRRFLVCLSKANRTYEIAARAEAIAVNALGRSQGTLAELFGGETADETDKLARCRWRPGPDGSPILDDAPAWFAGTIESTADAGDHVAFVLEPIAAELRRDFAPFPTSLGLEIEPGHQP